MDTLQAFVFAASCAERQWPIYDGASQGRKWAQLAVLRGTLDAIWEWLLPKRQRPRGYAIQCNRAILEEIEDDAANAASEVATSFCGLASIVEQNEPRHCIQAAKSNLSMIDAFLYELLGLPISRENDLRIDSHDLMRNEMARQDADLALLSRGIPMPAVVAEIRDRSRGQSLFGQYWYPEAT
jgi:hypothetical protein